MPDPTTDHAALRVALGAVMCPESHGDTQGLLPDGSRCYVCIARAFDALWASVKAELDEVRKSWLTTNDLRLWERMRAAQAETALREYGDHLYRCAVSRGGDCDCGYTAALAVSLASEAETERGPSATASDAVILSGGVGPDVPASTRADGGALTPPSPRSVSASEPVCVCGHREDRHGRVGGCSEVCRCSTYRPASGYPWLQINHARGLILAGKPNDAAAALHDLLAASGLSASGETEDDDGWKFTTEKLSPFCPICGTDLRALPAPGLPSTQKEKP